MLIYETNIVARYVETDQMGIVHHSNYPIWFEVARTDFIKNIGMTYSNMEERGFLLPLIELRCKYKSFAKYEDLVLIKTRIQEISFTRIKFYYEVYKDNGNKLITTGETEHAWTNKDLKPLNLKKHAPDIYSMIMAAYE